MLEYGASAPEYKYDDSKGLSFHDKTISLLYIPGHYQIIYTKSTIESNTVLDKYDDIDQIGRASCRERVYVMG